MKKIVSFISLILCSSLFFITGCKNFFDGKDFISSLGKTIEYNQAPYAAITINSPATYTDFISPAAGNWNSTYKCGDIIQLEFTPTANYQFTKWTATPEGSILFGENNINQYSAKVTAQIENIDEPITIEPKVYERPTITVSPGNTVENPRNSSIVISFSQNMNITEEDLSSIQILVDDVDALEYYQTPELNDEKNKITFVAKRENLIPVDLIAKTVKVLVPQTFNYLQDDCEITLKDLFSYSFRINSTTETKVNIDFECELTQGEISFTGTKELYLDNEFSVHANPKEGYLLTGWSVLYKDDKTPVEENILQLPDLTAPDAQDLSELKIKVLTGSSKAITISPVFEPRGFVMVKFITDVGTTSPSEEKKYYVGDTINISYRESGNFIFTGWQSSNEEAVSIANKKSLETTCEIKAASDPVTVKALCAERPYVTGIYPTTLTTVNKDSPIKILFSQSITESSIYWTLSELNAERISTSEYDLLAADGKKDEKGNQYYYAYQKPNAPDTLVYKNIAIKERNGGNLLKHYTVPFFETEENRTLVIQSKGGADSAPDYITIDVEVSPKFQSKEGVFVNQSYLQTFTTNSTTDNTPPNMKITYLEISGLSKPNMVAGSASFVYDQNFQIKEDESTYSTDNFKSHFKTEQDVTAVENMIQFISNFPKINSNSTIKIKIKGEISDEVSKPAFLSVSMVPTEDPRFTTSTSPTVKIPVSPDALGFYDFTEKEQIFEFPTNDLDGGIYKIIIKGYDKAN